MEHRISVESLLRDSTDSRVDILGSPRDGPWSAGRDQPFSALGCVAGEGAFST